MIYNLARPVFHVNYQYPPFKTMKTFVKRAINTLGLVKRVNASILQQSTIERYEDPKVHPQTESFWGNLNPLGTFRLCDEERELWRLYL
jgi:UDP-glucuronate decarboxylase